MYFTDKFPKSELKLMHAGLSGQFSGRKQPTIHKNITSTDFMFLSKIYSESRYQHSLPILPNEEDIKQISKLQLEINEKNRKIKEMESLLEEKKEKLSNSNPNYLKGQQEFYEEYTAELKNQIKEHEKVKTQEKRKKEEELLKRLSDLQKMKEDEAKFRKSMIGKAEEYKNVLETQKKLKKTIEYSQSIVFPALKTRKKSFFHIENMQEIKIPLEKNNNSLAVSMSSLPVFNEQRFTKNHPKVIRTSPILGQSD